MLASFQVLQATKPPFDGQFNVRKVQAPLEDFSFLL